jgi:hypothetical protein
MGDLATHEELMETLIEDEAETASVLREAKAAARYHPNSTVVFAPVAKWMVERGDTPSAKTVCNEILNADKVPSSDTTHLRSALYEHETPEAAKSSHFLCPPKSGPYLWVVLRPYRAVVCSGLVFANCRYARSPKNSPITTQAQ